MPKERNSEGQYRATVDADDVVGVFETVRGPVVTSADVADALDVTRETARRWLGRLVDDGDLDRRKTAGRVVYWHTGGERITPDARAREEDAEKAREVADSRSEDPDDRRDGPPPATSSTPQESDEREDAIADALAGWSHGRDGKERAASKTVARRSLEWLRDTPDAPVRRADAPLDDLAEDDPQTRTVDTLWTQVIRPAWDHAAEQGVIVKPSPRKYAWGGGE